MYAELTDALNMTGKDHHSHIRGYRRRRETTPLDEDYPLRGYGGVALLRTSVALAHTKIPV